MTHLQTTVWRFHPAIWTDLEPIWRSVTSRLPESSAFLSPEWIGNWLTIFGPLLRPASIVWKAPTGQVVGCALISEARVRLGPFHLQRTYLNASGELAVGSEFNDVLALPGYRQEILAGLVALVLGRGSDEFALTGATSTFADEIRSTWPTPSYEGFFSEGPYVSLDELRRTSTPYLSALSANSRARIRRNHRHYVEALGEPILELAVGGDQALEWFVEMVELHEARWRSRGLPGAFAQAEARRFHKCLIGQHAQSSGPNDSFAVDLIRVRCGGTTVAILYNLRYRRVVSFYQAGFNYAADTRLSPGLMAHTLAVEYYLGRGEGEYDFMAGETEPVQYKRSLATHVRPQAWVELPAPTARMKMIRWLREKRRWALAHLHRGRDGAVSVRDQG